MHCIRLIDALMTLVKHFLSFFIKDKLQCTSQYFGSNEWVLSSVIQKVPTFEFYFYHILS